MPKNKNGNTTDPQATENTSSIWWEWVKTNGEAMAKAVGNAVGTTGRAIGTAADIAKPVIYTGLVAASITVLLIATGAITLPALPAFFAPLALLAPFFASPIGITFLAAAIVYFTVQVISSSNQIFTNWKVAKEAKVHADKAEGYAIAAEGAQDKAEAAAKKAVTAKEDTKAAIIDAKTGNLLKTCQIVQKVTKDGQSVDEFQLKLSGADYNALTSGKEPGEVTLDVLLADNTKVEVKFQHSKPIVAPDLNKYWLIAFSVNGKNDFAAMKKELGTNLGKDLTVYDHEQVADTIVTNIIVQAAAAKAAPTK